MDNKGHDILPSPQQSPDQPSGQVQPGATNSGESGDYSENAGAKSVERPTITSPAQPVVQIQQAGSSPRGGTSSNDNGSSDNSNASQVAGSDTPAIADDNELIEKEWVEKAKEIVEKTKQDPYNQNKEIVRLRADYLKKRYNKDVKLGEE